MRQRPAARLPRPQSLRLRELRAKSTEHASDLRASLAASLRPSRPFRCPPLPPSLSAHCSLPDLQSTRSARPLLESCPLWSTSPFSLCMRPCCSAFAPSLLPARLSRLVCIPYFFPVAPRSVCPHSLLRSPSLPPSLVWTRCVFFLSFFFVFCLLSRCFLAAFVTGIVWGRLMRGRRRTAGAARLSLSLSPPRFPPFTCTRPMFCALALLVYIYIYSRPAIAIFNTNKTIDIELDWPRAYTFDRSRLQQPRARVLCLGSLLELYS